MARQHVVDPGARGATGPMPRRIVCPLALDVDTIGALVNGEIADHPVYDGFELQWFDDPVHGRGMLAFLQRRESRLVDYYVQPGLRLDRETYEIGGGTGAWVETRFDTAVLEVGADGVHAQARFVDVDGRRVEIVLDDRGAGPREEGDLLAPVGTGVDHPVSLLLVHLHGFDLLRRAGREPEIRIDGGRVSTGRLPARWLHGRHLVKAAAPVHVATVCRSRAGGPVDLVDPADPGGVTLDADGAIRRLRAATGDASARLDLDPPLPVLDRMPDGGSATGRWRVAVDGAPITGGTWTVSRGGDRVALALEVTDPWRPPAGQPRLLRVVTRVAPVFRRWPTTYRWRAEVLLGAATPTIESRWERVSTDRGGLYRRLTRS